MFPVCVINLTSFHISPYFTLFDDDDNNKITRVCVWPDARLNNMVSCMQRP